VPARVVRLFPEAEAEVIAHERWYAQRSRLAAEAFIAEVDDALVQIGESAETWRRYRRSTRRFVLHRFAAARPRYGLHGTGRTPLF
jgi:hypothetical protein